MSPIRWNSQLRAIPHFVGSLPLRTTRFILRYRCEDIILGWLHGLDACWLAFWLERENYVMPLQTALGFVQRANVICPTCNEHKKHFISFGLWQSFQL